MGRLWQEVESSVWSSLDQAPSLRASIKSLLFSDLDKGLSFDVIIVLSLARQLYVSSCTGDAVFIAERQTHSSLSSTQCVDLRCIATSWALLCFTVLLPGGLILALRACASSQFEIQRNTSHLLISLHFPTFSAVQPDFKVHQRCMIEPMHLLCLQVDFLPWTVPSMFGCSFDNS